MRDMTTSRETSRYRKFVQDASSRLMGFSLGAAIGGVLVWILYSAHTSEQFEGLIGVISALIGGAGVLAASRFKLNMSSAGYATGLLIAILWGYAKVGLDNVGAPITSHVLLGLAQILALILGTATAMYLFVLPEVLNVWSILLEAIELRKRGAHS